VNHHELARSTGYARGMSLQRGRPLYEQMADTLRAEIRAGRYRPGDKLPSERELSERFSVSKVTARQAIVQLRAEGLVTSRVGYGVFVADPGPPRRLSDDILRGEAFYRAVDRLGLEPNVATTITREPATEEVAEALDVEVGEEVLVHVRLTRAQDEPPLFLADNYFPSWVVEAVPQLASPSTSGLTKWLGEAFGPLYGEDLIDSRMPTPEQRERLEIPEGVPVTIIKGVNRDSQHRALHYIVKVTVAGRMQYGYRFGVMPES
jgi:GntR family transcriptional regulator